MLNLARNVIGLRSSIKIKESVYALLKDKANFKRDFLTNQI